MPDELGPDGRREGLDVDDDEVDRADVLGLELGHLLVDVAPGQDPRVDRMVERLDLPADVGWPSVRSVTERDVDALAGEVLARAVGGEHLHVEGMEVPGERRDTLPVRD